MKVLISRYVGVNGVSRSVQGTLSVVIPSKFSISSFRGYLKGKMK